MMMWYDMAIMTCCTLPILMLNAHWPFLSIGTCWRQNIKATIGILLMGSAWWAVMSYFQLESMFVMELSIRQVKHFVIGCILNSAIMTMFWHSYGNMVHRN